jgi:hypothetical protein
VSTSTREVDELIFSNRLTSTPGAAAVSRAEAGKVAQAFAIHYFAGFSHLSARTITLLDHRSFSEYQFAWQERRGSAWLPVAVTVGVNATTGQVAYYWSERGPAAVSTTPRVSSAYARREAAKLLGGGADLQAGNPALNVVVVHGAPELVWITSVSQIADRQPFIPGATVVWTNALTGSSHVVAAGGEDMLRHTPSARSSAQAAGASPARASAAPPSLGGDTGANAALPSEVPAYGSCYDALYYDGLDSRYSANHCASALSAAGYTPRPYDNTSAQTAAINSETDAVFFMAGHSMDLYDNGCVPSCSGAHTAAALLYESPNSGGPLDGLAGDAFTSAYWLDSTGPTTICGEGGGCHSQTGFVAYPWGDGNPQTFKLNLAVLEACATAQETATYTSSMADYVHDYWAGNVIGFVDDISFPTNVDESNQYGDAWANTFWSDLGSGATYAAAVVDAANAVGNQYGFNSWVLLRYGSAPTSLYPAQYYPFLQ